MFRSQGKIYTVNSILRGAYQSYRDRKEAWDNSCIPEEEKKDLEELCAEVRKDYVGSNGFDFKRAFENFSIYLIEDEKVMSNAVSPFLGFGYSLLMHPFGRKEYRNIVLAHELGHIVLAHEIEGDEDDIEILQLEQEATLFSRLILGHFSMWEEWFGDVTLHIHLLKYHPRELLLFIKDPESYESELISSYYQL